MRVGLFFWDRRVASGGGGWFFVFVVYFPVVLLEDVIDFVFEFYCCIEREAVGNLDHNAYAVGTHIHFPLTFTGLDNAAVGDNLSLHY